jgi:hypothetical protein
LVRKAYPETVHTHHDPDRRRLAQLMLGTEQIGMVMVEGDLDEARFRTSAMASDRDAENGIRAMARAMEAMLGPVGTPALDGCGHAFLAFVA